MSKFKLTRSEFSNKLGIPTDTLKKRMRRGQYKDQYIFENGKYLFSGDVKVGPIKAVPKPLSLGTKRRNRGNHFDSKNPNYKPQFRQTNEIRMVSVNCWALPHYIRAIWFQSSVKMMLKILQR